MGHYTALSILQVTRRPERCQRPLHHLECVKAEGSSASTAAAGLRSSSAVSAKTAQASQHIRTFLSAGARPSLTVSRQTRRVWCMAFVGQHWRPWRRHSPSS